MKTLSSGKAIGLTICILVIGYFVWYQVTDILYWAHRRPRDMKSALRGNEKRIDHAVSAVERYYQYHGAAPVSLSDLVNDPVALRSWLQLIDDEWGRPIGYSVGGAGTGTVVRIWSYGGDGKPGGEGPAADTFREWSPNVSNATERVNENKP